jgi:hypothetical protein
MVNKYMADIRDNGKQQSSIDFFLLPANKQGRNAALLLLLLLKKMIVSEICK